MGSSTIPSPSSSSSSMEADNRASSLLVPSSTTKNHECQQHLNKTKAKMDACNGRSLLTPSSTSVPRKIRSATNKRTRESISPALLLEHEKPNAHVSNKTRRRTPPSSSCDGVKKTQQESKQKIKVYKKSCRKGSFMAMTKTEEEVAEVLFDLSRLVAESSCMNKNTSKREMLSTSPPPSNLASCPSGDRHEDTQKNYHKSVEPRKTSCAKPEAGPAATLPVKFEMGSGRKKDDSSLDLASSTLADVPNAYETTVIPNDSDKRPAQLACSDVNVMRDNATAAVKIDIINRNPGKVMLTERNAGYSPFTRNTSSSGMWDVHLDPSGPIVDKGQPCLRPFLDGTVAASTAKVMPHERKTRKHSITHVYISHFILVYQNFNAQKMAKYPTQCWNASSRRDGTTNCHPLNSGGNVGNRSHQLLEEKHMLPCDYVHQKQGVDLMPLLPGDDGDKLGTLRNSADVTAPSCASPVPSVDPHEADAQILPCMQYIASPFLNPHLSAAASAAKQKHTTQSGKSPLSVELPKWQTTPFGLCSQQISSLGESPSTSYSHNPLIFPTILSRNCKQQEHR